MSMAIVLMGVSGCGKTSVGERLAEILGWPFFDADDFHSQENVAKMSQGISLNDDDRDPWLDRMQGIITGHLMSDRSMLLACSALKRKYRAKLTIDNPGTVFVYLKGDIDMILGRMQARAGHYMKVDMLQSQFDTLEEPMHAIVVNIDQTVAAIVDEIIKTLHLNLPKE